jgi:hypothetical protein
VGTADEFSDQAFLLVLLNITPVVNGVPTDELADAARARAWLASVGGLGTESELQQVLDVRQALQAVVRGEQPPTVLDPILREVTYSPSVVEQARQEHEVLMAEAKDPTSRS